MDPSNLHQLIETTRGKPTRVDLPIVIFYECSTCGRSYELAFVRDWYRKQFQWYEWVDTIKTAIEQPCALPEENAS